MNPLRLRAYAQLLIVAIIWSLAGIVIKLTLNNLSPEIFLLYRLFISSLATLVLIPFTGMHLPKKPGVFMNFIIYGLLNSSVSLGLLFWGTSKTSLLDMSLISVFAPILTIFAGYIFLKDHITKRERMGILIAFIGSFVILIEPIFKGGGDGGRVSGNLLVFASIITGTMCAVFLKKLLRDGVSPLTLSNTSFVIGFISLLPVVLALHSPNDILRTITALPLKYHLGVFYMAIFSGNLAYFLLNAAYKSIEISEAAVFSYIYPIASAILAIFFLGDRLTAIIAVGSVITLAGVAIAEIKKERVA